MQTSAAPAKHQFEALDGLRGLFALAIATYHFKILWHGYNTPLLEASYMAVDFFFLLSGFVISHAMHGKLQTFGQGARFMLRRLGRLWPLHLFTLGMVVANEFLRMGLIATTGISVNELPFDPNGLTPLATLPVHIFLLQGMNFDTGHTWNGASWSISAEFFTYLLFAVLTVGLRGRLRTAAMVGCIALSGILLYKLEPSLNLATYHNGFLRCVISFFIGHFIYRLWQARPTLRLASATGTELLAVALMLLFPLATYLGKASLLAPFMLAIPLWIFAYQQGAVSRTLQTLPFQKLGLWSYSIYMVHIPISIYLSQAITAAEKLLHRSFHTDYLDAGTTTPHNIIDLGNYLSNDVLMAFYLLACVIPFAAFTYRFIETPCRLYVNKLATRL